MIYSFSATFEKPDSVPRQTFRNARNHTLDNIRGLLAKTDIHEEYTPRVSGGRRMYFVTGRSNGKRYAFARDRNTIEIVTNDKELWNRIGQ